LITTEGAGAKIFLTLDEFSSLLSDGLGTIEKLQRKIIDAKESPNPQIRFI
jgi:hypothetical protein